MNRGLRPVWVCLLAPLVSCEAFWGLKGSDTSSADTGCDETPRYECSAGDVYRMSCGTATLDQDCEGASCAEEGDEASCCTSEYGQECYGGDVFWVDGCGFLEERAESCADGCIEENLAQARCCDATRLSKDCDGSQIVTTDDCGDVVSRESCPEACWKGECVQSTCDLYLRFDPATCAEVEQVHFGDASSVYANHNADDCEDDDPDLCQLRGSVPELKPGESWGIDCHREFPSNVPCGTDSVSFYCQGVDAIEDYVCNDGDW